MTRSGWEGYQNIAAGAVPETTRWETSGKVGPLRVDFGGDPDSPEPLGWGSPFRRITDTRTGKVTFAAYRRVLEP